MIVSVHRRPTSSTDALSASTDERRGSNAQEIISPKRGRMVILFRKARSATDTAEALYSAYVRNYCYQAIAQVFAVYSPFSDKKVTLAILSERMVCEIKSAYHN